MTAVSTYLDVAAQLAADVAASAIWSGARCSWVGGMPDEGPAGIEMTYAAFGPDVYAGTAGVALALAELYAATGEPELARTARGALEHSLSRVGDVPERVALGAYAGRLGIAIAAARVGVVLGEERFAEEALAVALDGAASPEPPENDLLSGRAGGIVALLVLRRLTGREDLLERAKEIGDALIAAGERDEDRLSWPSPSFPDQRHLTGLSHGAAGVALALAELYRASGDARFRAPAEAGFAYERSLFDEQMRNWPDLREIVFRGKPPDAPPAYPALWCHGAPGIALSRLRALEILGDEVYRDEALVALETTARTVRLELGAGNYSLCHGLAGNAEILLEGRDVLGPDAEELAHAVADAGVQAYARPGAAWPGGVFDGRTDGLFLGRAGTAYFYLRLHDRAVPSVLLLRPEQYRREASLTTPRRLGP